MADRITLTTTKDALHAAAAACPNVAKALKTLFPDHFDAELRFEPAVNLDGGYGWMIGTCPSRRNTGVYVGIQDEGDYAYRGIYLDGTWRWELVTDSNGQQVAIPIEEDNS